MIRHPAVIDASDRRPMNHDLPSTRLIMTILQGYPGLPNAIRCVGDAEVTRSFVSMIGSYRQDTPLDERIDEAFCRNCRTQSTQSRGIARRRLPTREPCATGRSNHPNLRTKHAAQMRRHPKRPLLYHNRVPDSTLLHAGAAGGMARDYGGTAQTVGSSFLSIRLRSSPCAAWRRLTSLSHSPGAGES